MKRKTVVRLKKPKIGQFIIATTTQKCYGPFDDPNHAAAWAKLKVTNIAWWIVVLHEPH